MLRPADAIIVLGAAVWSGGKPSPTLKRRTLHAADLYRNGLAPIVVLSGGLGRHPPSEAEAMAAICADEGVARDALILENRSTSTFENVQLCGEILWSRGVHRVIVVSDDFHLPRATMCFRYLGFETQASAAPRSALPGSWRRRLRSRMREVVARPAYRVMMRRRLIRPTEDTRQ